MIEDDNSEEYSINPTYEEILEVCYITKSTPFLTKNIQDYNNILLEIQNKSRLIVDRRRRNAFILLPNF